MKQQANNFVNILVVKVHKIAYLKFDIQLNLHLTSQIKKVLARKSNFEKSVEKVVTFCFTSLTLLFMVPWFVTWCYWLFLRRLRMWWLHVYVCVFPCDFDEKIEEKIALFFFHLRTFSGWELVLPVDNTVVKQTFF